jgi:hypothetical protein
MWNIDLTKYKFLFPKEWDTIQNNLMFFWVSCGDWWNTILYALFEEIQEIIQEDDSLYNFQFIQIKEKYGSLRLYYEWANSRIDNLCIAVEQLSCHVCEQCSEPGKIRDDLGRYQTLCEDCYLVIKKERDERILWN